MNQPLLERWFIHWLSTVMLVLQVGKAKGENNIYTLKGTDRNQNWSLRLNDDGSINVDDVVSGQSYAVANSDGVWSLTSKNVVGKKK